jgi:hypothetical protein
LLRDSNAQKLHTVPEQRYATSCVDEVELTEEWQFKIFGHPANNRKDHPIVARL